MVYENEFCKISVISPDSEIVTVYSSNKLFCNWWVKVNLKEKLICDSKKDLISEEWRESAKIFALKTFEEIKNIDFGRRCFIRYGKPPKSGRSYNVRDGYLEPGVSVYPAFRKGKIVKVNLAGIEPTSYIHLQYSDQVKYFVEGKIIGKGSDGEPCIKVTTYRKIPQDYLVELI